MLKAGFGNDRRIAATIFRENGERLPVRMVAFELEAKEDALATRSLTDLALIEELKRIETKRGDGAGAAGIFFERVARIYDSSDGAPTVFVVKPDLNRHWTRSQAMHDADEVSADLFRWGKTGRGGRT